MISVFVSGGLGAVHLADVKGAEFPLRVWERSPPEAAVLMPEAFS